MKEYWANLSIDRKDLNAKDYSTPELINPSFIILPALEFSIFEVLHHFASMTSPSIDQFSIS
jgi:hypothetical protein